MKSRRVPSQHVFACPACGESLHVNDAMRRALLEHGCVVCGESVTGVDFTDLEVSD